MRKCSLSLKALYDALVKDDAETVPVRCGYVQKEIVGGEDYYDLKTAAGNTPCMDGEVCVILEEHDGYVMLMQEDENIPFELSTEEFRIASFNEEQAEYNAGSEIIKAEGYCYEGRRLKRIVLGRKRRDDGTKEYTTWESWFDPTAGPSKQYDYYYGHYFDDYRKAAADYHRRLAEKIVDYGEEDVVECEVNRDA